MDNLLDDHKNSSEIRAVYLLRASTSQQTDENNEIPNQQKIVRDYIDKNGWTIVREFVEGGISGYKIKAENRDALQTIKKMALNNEFDVLVVINSDRLGRVADETPLVIKFLVEKNIKVFSVTEGEIKYTSHEDKLSTFIKFWMHEGESDKKKVLIANYHKSMIEKGEYRGGTLPFGYKALNKGSVNFKGKPILDVVIDEYEASVIKRIFSLNIEINFGYRKISERLNNEGHKNRTGHVWTYSTIKTILNNPMYIGQYRMKSGIDGATITSPIIKELSIITPEEFEKSKRQIFSRNCDPDKVTKGKRNIGRLLLNGLVFCGECGQRLTTKTDVRPYQTKEGIKKSTSYKYYCMSANKRLPCAAKKKIYGRTVLEPKVLAVTSNFIQNIQNKAINEDFVKDINTRISETSTLKSRTQKKLEALFKEAKTLRNEIPKALSGDSIFSPQELKELLTEKERNIKDVSDVISTYENELTKLETDKNSYASLGGELEGWQDKFDNSTLEGQRAMLSQIIEKILVWEDKIRIVFSVQLETFNKNSTNIVVHDSVVRSPSRATPPTILSQYKTNYLQ